MVGQLRKRRPHRVAALPVGAGQSGRVDLRPVGQRQQMGQHPHSPERQPPVADGVVGQHREPVRMPVAQNGAHRTAPLPAVVAPQQPNRPDRVLRSAAPTSGIPPPDPHRRYGGRRAEPRAPTTPRPYRAGRWSRRPGVAAPGLLHIPPNRSFTTPHQPHRGWCARFSLFTLGCQRSRPRGDHSHPKRASGPH